MENVNYYRILGIQAKGATPLHPEEITDAKILEQYKKMTNKIATLLQNVMLTKNDNETPEEKEKKEKKIQILETSLGKLNEAFKTLETEEKREIYEEEYDNNLTSEIILRKLARQTGENIEDIETTQINMSNRAAEVKEDKEHLPYTPLYLDDEIQILELAKINFLNGGYYKDELSQLMILLKKKDEYIPLGYDCYANIIVEKMQENEYKSAFYKAIRKAIKEKERYIGEIRKNQEEKYFIQIDGGQRDAAKEHQMQLENS